MSEIKTLKYKKTLRIAGIYVLSAGCMLWHSQLWHPRVAVRMKAQAGIWRKQLCSG